MFPEDQRTLKLVLNMDKDSELLLQQRHRAMNDARDGGTMKPEEMKAAPSRVFVRVRAEVMPTSCNIAPSLAAVAAEDGTQ